MKFSNFTYIDRKKIRDFWDFSGKSKISKFQDFRFSIGFSIEKFPIFFRKILKFLKNLKNLRFFSVDVCKIWNFQYFLIIIFLKCFRICPQTIKKIRQSPTHQSCCLKSILSEKKLKKILIFKSKPPFCWLYCLK